MIQPVFVPELSEQSAVVVNRSRSSSRVSPRKKLVIVPSSPRKKREAEVIAVQPVAANSDASRVESLYREMLDRERDMFMSILDSQAKWMSEMQSQMLNTCLALQSNNELKKQRRD